MNDQQLLEALRGLDRPVMPERTFADDLYAVLERRVRPRRQPSRTMLLVAALLAAAALGSALVVGSQLFREEPIVVAPSLLPTADSYTVSIPDGSVPESSPQEVAAASAILGRVQSMTFIPAGSAVPVGDGVSEALEGAYWQVVVFRSGETATFYLSDDGLRVTLLEAAPTPEPTQSFVPVASWDPSAPLALVSDLGRTIVPTVVAIPDLAPGLEVSSLTAVGELAWATVSDTNSGEIRFLVRLDARSGTASRVPLPAGVTARFLIAGGDTLLLGTSGPGMLVLDPVTGESRRTLLVPFDGGVLGADEDGLWFRIAAGVSPTARAGAALVDPETGAVLRSIYTPELQGAYRGFLNPPAFGSLWDVDRGRAFVLRIDPVGGDVQAQIDLTRAMPAEQAARCNDPEPGIEGVPELESLVIVYCGEVGEVLIDPETNQIVEVVPLESGMVPSFVGIGIGGRLWVGSQPGTTSSDWSEVLVRVDPVTRMQVETLAFNRERLTASSPVVIGDDVWFVVGERAYDGDPYRQNQVIVRIPVAELTR